MSEQPLRDLPSDGSPGPDEEGDMITLVPPVAPVLPIGPRKRPQRGPDARRRIASAAKPRSLLWYGDNLKVLRERVATESVDLVYLDPPFNSNRTYNVLFRSHDGSDAPAQIQAFDDTWHWNDATREALRDLYQTAPLPVRSLMDALHRALGENDITAYLVMMTQRLVELHRVMKQSGSLYLHCDPTASHYLKIMMDAIFGSRNFRSEIIWKRTSAHSSARRYGPVHDTLLFHTRSDKYHWNPQYQAYDEEYRKTFFNHVDVDGRSWKRVDLTGAGTRNGPSGDPWRGIDVRAKGRHWAYVPEELDRLDRDGLVHWPRRSGGMPRLKQYEDMMLGVPIQDVWTDIRPMHNLSPERIGYPTQKPLALLERIIAASSSPGDVVLDPFCGCGTAVVAAEKLGRRWIGIDITSLAVGVIENRLDALFEAASFQVRGLPEHLNDAIDLAKRDRFQFQWWAAGRIHALPHDGREKKGADGGIDGVITFFDDSAGKLKRCIVSVKSGQTVGPTAVRDLSGTVTATGAQVGVLLTLTPPTPAMRKAAAEGGLYHSPLGRDYPRIQILTVEDILKPPCPGSSCPRRPTPPPAPNRSAVGGTAATYGSGMRG